MKKVALSALVGLTLVVSLSSCAHSYTPAETQQYQKQNAQGVAKDRGMLTTNDLNIFYKKIILPDGTKVPCLMTYDYTVLSCRWDQATNDR